jgi:hypothetical protein
MNEKVSKTWFMKLQDSLYEQQWKNMVIIMDNAGYHSIRLNMSDNKLKRK